MRSVFRLPVICLFLCLSPMVRAGPLHDAAKEGDIALINKLLDEGADVNKPSFIATPLYFAVESGHLDAAAVLIQRGADVNAVSNGGMPLHYVARAGLLDMARILLEKASANAAHGKDLTAA